MEKLVLLLLSLTFVQCSPVMTRQSLIRQKNQEHFCSNLINFNNFYYSMDETRNVSGIPADMSIHWKTGNVFFTLISEEMKMSLQVLHPSGDTETIKVAGLGQSTCVDNLNDVIYLATDNGVYKYKEDASIELYTALGEDVMYITVTSDGSAMYIATWPQNRVYVITGDGQKQESFPAVPNGHGLTVDTRSNIFFVATKTSYILKNGYTVPIKIKGLPDDKMIGIFVSRSDEVYGMDETSNLFVIDAETTNARHLGSFNVTGVNSFAMDSADNVLIGVKGAIVKFNAFERNPCAEFNKIQLQNADNLDFSMKNQEKINLYKSALCKLRTVYKGLITAAQSSPNLINTDSDCLIKTNNVTVITQQTQKSTPNIEENVETSFIALINNTTNISLKHDSTENIKYNDKLSRKIEEKKEAEFLTDSNDLSYHDIHHYTVIYGIIGVIVIVGIVWMCRRVRRGRRKAPAAATELNTATELYTATELVAVGSRCGYGTRRSGSGSSGASDGSARRLRLSLRQLVSKTRTATSKVNKKGKRHSKRRRQRRRTTTTTEAYEEEESEEM